MTKEPPKNSPEISLFSSGFTAPYVHIILFPHILHVKHGNIKATQVVQFPGVLKQASNH